MFIKRKFAAVCFVLIFGFFATTQLTGCGGSAKDEGGSGVSDADMPKIELTDKVVSVYNWMDYVPEKEFDWQGFRLADVYGGEVETIKGGANYYEDLFKRVAAGEIPDITIADMKSFPQLIMRGLAEPWDDYIDFTDPIWEKTGALEAIDLMKWDGKVYNITNKPHVLGVMFYNKKIINEAGLEDPIALQEKGEWTWENFKKYLSETTVDSDGDGKTDMSGIVNTGDFPTAFFASTGETPIDYKDGEFINNVKSDKVRAAADFLYGIGDKGDGLMSFSDPTDAFNGGKAAFVYTNDYRGYEDYSALLQSGDLGVLPMPKYSGADSQYQGALPDFAWLMKGAKNPEGAAALQMSLQYDAMLNMDPAVKTIKESVKKNTWMAKGFTDENANQIIETTSLPAKILWSRCITLSGGDLEVQALKKPWTTLADSQEGVINKAIKDAVKPR